jgi:pyruvate dehydrogenase E2 component (dihydrolipoamide acetyltransferase)
MAVEMIMPKVDMDQETGTVVEWLKTNGQKVEEGEAILVIETDKIAIDVEAPASGILEGISANPGDVIPIGKVIAYILDEGEKLPEGAASPVTSPASKEDKRSSRDPEEVVATPVARQLAASQGVDLKTITPSGKGGKILKKDVEKALQGERPLDREGDLIATPAARRTARIKGIDLDKVSGTGPGGRIQKSDVEKIQTQAGVRPSYKKVQRGERIPLVGKRRTIAERLTASHQSIPHIQFTNRVNMSALFKVRNDLNQMASKEGGEKISVTDMLVKWVAIVLADHPWLNSSLLEESVVFHQDINIGLAVALEEGLIVPVVKNADQKTLREIAAETSDLIARAREGTLVSADVKGGTFTISNLGPYGIEAFTAIINPPEVGILAVGATIQEVVALGEGVFGVQPVMRVTLSADHRVVDGAVAARFMEDLKTRLEDPLEML